jgi:hypothetical protein
VSLAVILTSASRIVAASDSRRWDAALAASHDDARMARGSSDWRSSREEKEIT